MYTIKEVAIKTGVSEHTVRYWAKSGFFPFIKRSESNVRLFEDSDLEWVKIVKCLRLVGMDSKSVKKYIDLCVIGDSTIKERFQIITDTRLKTQAKIKELTEQLSLLEYKENFYDNIIKYNLQDIWNPMNKSHDKV